MSVPTTPTYSSHAGTLAVGATPLLELRKVYADPTGPPLHSPMATSAHAVRRRCEHRDVSRPLPNPSRSRCRLAPVVTRCRSRDRRLSQPVVFGVDGPRGRVCSIVGRAFSNGPSHLRRQRDEARDAILRGNDTADRHGPIKIGGSGGARGSSGAELIGRRWRLGGRRTNPPTVLPRPRSEPTARGIENACPEAGLLRVRSPTGTRRRTSRCLDCPLGLCVGHSGGSRAEQTTAGDGLPRSRPHRGAVE